MLLLPLLACAQVWRHPAALLEERWIPLLLLLLKQLLLLPLLLVLLPLLLFRHLLVRLGAHEVAEGHCRWRHPETLQLSHLSCHLL